MFTYDVFTADPINYGHPLGRVQAANISHALTLACEQFNGPIGVKLAD